VNQEDQGLAMVFSIGMNRFEDTARAAPMQAGRQCPPGLARRPAELGFSSGPQVQLGNQNNSLSNLHRAWATLDSDMRALMTRLARGAASEPPWPPCSTRTATATWGLSAGA
jgi:hypothetical protein